MYTLSQDKKQPPDRDRLKQKQTLFFLCLFLTCLLVFSWLDKSTYSDIELASMPADELFDLFVDHGLYVDEDLLFVWGEDGLKQYFKENFHILKTGRPTVHSYTGYRQMAISTKEIYEKLTHGY